MSRPGFTRSAIAPRLTAALALCGAILAGSPAAVAFDGALAASASPSASPSTSPSASESSAVATAHPLAPAPIGPPAPETREPDAARDGDDEPPPTDARPSLPLDAPEDDPAPAQVAPAERPEVVVRTLLGLVVLLGLAYLGGHRRVQEWERRARISQVITSGFPFVVLGLIASHAAIDVLNDRVLSDLGPILRLGLGWIGFIVGFRFDAKRIQELPTDVAAIAARRVMVAFVAIACATAAVHVGVLDVAATSLADPVFFRDALVLGAAGVVTSRGTPLLLTTLGVGRASANAVSMVVRVEELAAIVCLSIVAAYFRPAEDPGWTLPGTAWLLLTLGLGLAVGAFVYAIMLLRTSSAAESLVLALGSVSFGAGLAGTLRLSPVVVCFVAGVLLANFPGTYKERLRHTLASLERPIYFLFLTVVGALWYAGDEIGWLLMAAFVAARLLGRWAASRISWGGTLGLEPHARRALAFGPMGGLPVAIVVNAGILYPGRSVSWMVTAVLGAAAVSEVLVQLVVRREVPATSTPVPWSEARPDVADADARTSTPANEGASQPAPPEPEGP
jgi:hypothetical protein